MPRLLHQPPKYRLHKTTGQAVVSVFRRQIYLGKYGTPESHQRYEQEIARWRTSLAEKNSESKASEDELSLIQKRITANTLRERRHAGNLISINELILVFLKHARAYYRKNGKVTREAEQIAEVLGFLRIHEEHPDAQVTAIEMNRTLSDVLSAKGIDVEFGDFLEHSLNYDRIVMNPPFEKSADIDHVKHAFSLLASGGRLVSVMGEGSFFRTDKKSAEFRNWLAELAGEVYELPDDAFNTAEAFRQTGVKTRLVVIDKA